MAKKKKLLQIELLEVFMILDLEGGWYELLRWGDILPEDVDNKDFKRLWTKAIKQFTTLEKTFEELEALRPSEWDEDEEEEDDEDGRFKLH